MRVHRDSVTWPRRLGRHVFSYSIAIRLGDVRIGIILPSTLEDVTTRLPGTSLNLYPEGCADCPHVVMRHLAAHDLLVDFVFTKRFGSVDMTHAALSAIHEDNPAIILMADALAHELIHINHGIMHRLAEMGYMLAEDGITPPEEQEYFLLETSLSRHEILEALGIDPARIYPVGKDKYFVYAPKDGPEHDRLKKEVEKINRQVTP